MPNPAAEMEDWEFSSLDELNNYLREKTDRMNREPLDDFLGLSPELMYRITSLPLSDNTDYLSLAGDVSEEDVPGIPILRQIRWLLNHLKIAGKVKLTSAGYLPPALALSWFDETFRPFTDKITLEISPVRRESDELLMPWVRAIMQKMRLIFPRKGQLGISTRGKEFLQTACPDQYRQLFYYLADEWVWSEYEYFRFEVSPFHQDTLPFFLHALNRQGSDGLSETDIERIYTTAFPQYFDPVEDDSFVYFLVLIEPARNFTEPLGLSHPMKLEMFRRGVVPTELFQRELNWTVDI